MTRFTFNLRSGNGDLETEEVDLPDAGAARREAIHACGDFLREMDATFEAKDAWEMEVVDDQGKPICVLRFSSENFVDPAKAGKGHRR